MVFPDNGNFNLERHMARTEAQLELLSDKLKNLESQLDKNDGITDKVKMEINFLKDQISNISSTLQEVQTKTDKVANNVFLQFTADITSQKLITVVLVISTVVSSPTLITSWLNGSLPDQEKERIVRLLDLLQENEENF